METISRSLAFTVLRFGCRDRIESWICALGEYSTSRNARVPVVCATVRPLRSLLPPDVSLSFRESRLSIALLAGNYKSSLSTDSCRIAFKATEIKKTMVTEGQEKKYDEYKCTLDADTLEMARLELRENDSTREQALEQFRHWIEKHPAIKKCRTDSPFLLRFLRTKKFSLPMAQEMLERYLTIRQLYPDWFQKLDIDDPELKAIIDAGYLVPMLKRDRHGRKVIMSCAGRFDPNKFSSIHLARVHSIVVESLMDDEKSQIHGYTYINDEAGLTMSHFSAWSFTDIRNMLRCIQNGTPMRHKETHFINIPGVVMKIIEFGVSLLNDKLKSRIMIHKDMQELQEAMDPKILPKEYGGEIPLSEMIDEFKKELKQKNGELKALDDMYIEISPKDYHEANEEFGGICGSFRKLEVD